MIYIGIDTGVNTGFSVYDSKTKCLLDVRTLKLHQAMKAVENLHEEHHTSNLVVRVEDPRQRTWFGTEKMPREEERKRLQGVGSVKRDASIWEDFLSDLGVVFEMVPPKRSITKMDSDTFKQYTKWTGRTSEHARDAAMLVFGY